MNLHVKKRSENLVFRMLETSPLLSREILRFLFNNRHRNARIYCVGLPRSGTHSIAHILSTALRSRHEPLTGSSLKLCRRIKKKQLEKTEIFTRIELRDLYLNIEVEASHYLYSLVPYLVELYPNSKFILSVREPRSWLLSEINMNLKTSGQKIWDDYQSFKYNNWANHYNSEYLKESNYLYCIESYLKYYKEHIQLVTRNVPKDRLLLIDTFNISSNLKVIADFAEVNISDLNLKKQHSSKGIKKVQLADLSDDETINNLIRDECLDFIQEYVPFLERNMDYLDY